MICKTFDIILLPFPFTDKSMSKKRPALVLSSTLQFNALCNHTIVAMITSALQTPWPLDTLIQNLETTHLSKKSIIRMKLFTIDNRLIIKKIGSLCKKDREKVAINLKKCFWGK